MTMGTEDSVEALKRAVAMGITKRCCLSDPAFKGSDAWGTAAILAAAVRRKVTYCLVLTGKTVGRRQQRAGRGRRCQQAWACLMCQM